MRLALGAVRAVTDRAPGGRSRRERRRARERDEESTPLVSPSSAVPTPSSGTGGFCDGDDGVATCSRACRARWTCVFLTAFTALAAVTYVTTTTARGGATSTLAPGRFFVRDARATSDANFCASTSETSDGRRGVTCASVCDAARAPEVFEVREAEEGVGGYATVSRVRANGETTRCATGWRDGGKASSVIACDDDGETDGRPETARERFVIARTRNGGRRRRRRREAATYSVYSQEFKGYCRDENGLASCGFSRWSTLNARYAFVPVDDASVAACAPLRNGEST